MEEAEAAGKEQAESEDDEVEEVGELNSIEKILDARPATAEGSRAGEEEEYLCKLKGHAHLHARWLTRAAILEDGRLSLQRLRTFERKRQVDPSLPAQTLPY